MEIKWLNDDNNDTICMNYTDMKILTLYLDKFEEDSNLYIDIYSDFRLSPVHASSLLDIIENDRINLENNKINLFIKMLQDSVITKKWLILIGD